MIEIERAFLEKSAIRFGKKEVAVPAIIDCIPDGKLQDDQRFHLWEEYAPKYHRMLKLRCTTEGWNQMKDLLPKDNGGVVLDAGCGTGEILESLTRRLHSARIIGADVSPAFLRRAQQRIATTLPSEAHRISLWRVDLTQPLPWKHDTFDLVTMNFVFQYFSEAEQKNLLAGLSDVLKDRGELYLSTFIKGVDFKNVVRRAIPREAISNPIGLLQALTIVPVTKKFDAFKNIGQMNNPTQEELLSWCQESGFSQVQKKVEIFDGAGVIIKATK